MGGEVGAVDGRRVHRRWRSWLSRTLIVIIGLLAVLLAVGLAYESIASRPDMECYPPQESWPVLGDYKPHLNRTGSRLPGRLTVFLEARGDNGSHVRVMIMSCYFEMDASEDIVASDNDVLETNGFGHAPLIVIAHDSPDAVWFGLLKGNDLYEAERHF